MAYNRTEAVDMRRMQSSAAPARRNIPNTRPRTAPKPQVLQKTKRQLRAEEFRSTKKATKALIVCSIFFFLIALQIYSQVQVDELDRQLDSINQQIEVVESENTRLNMELDSIISLDKVDDYAQNVLGMVKVENYQVSYIDLSGGDAITQSGGKIQRSLWETIKMYF
ncbi:MAG: hypothetical protein MJ115_00930 [Clostridia bacterium]|nr:hypothetical protein [Clostridia bacterium]